MLLSVPAVTKAHWGRSTILLAPPAGCRAVLPDSYGWVEQGYSCHDGLLQGRGGILEPFHSQCLWLVPCLLLLPSYGTREKIFFPAEVHTIPFLPTSEKFYASSLPVPMSSSIVL